MDEILVVKYEDTTFFEIVEFPFTIRLIFARFISPVIDIIPIFDGLFPK